MLQGSCYNSVHECACARTRVFIHTVKLFSLGEIVYKWVHIYTCGCMFMSVFIAVVI